MSDQQTLCRTVKDLIARNCEGVYWDFKREHHAYKSDLIHDVLCLANAGHAGPRFLIFGVDNADFSLHDIRASGGNGSAWMHPPWRKPRGVSGNRAHGPSVMSTDSSVATTTSFRSSTLKAASAEFKLDSDQEWTRGEIVTEGNHAGWFELRCHQTVLRRIHYVSFDGHKKSMVAPHWVPIGRGRFYFYKAGSVEYAVQQFWAKHKRRDDSCGLLIRGEGESASRAQSRWRCGLNIPVVEPGELEEFLEGRRCDSISGPDPTIDRDEQYDRFLRNILDFDDWRRAQKADG